jgi:hypothetical protein
MLRYLAGILGKRAFYSFALVTFLVSALLVTVSLASRHALKTYVEDQLTRIRWDIAVYDAGSRRLTGREVTEHLRDVPGVERVESLTFLRAVLPEEVKPQVDGKPLATPWLCMMSATEESLFPPQLQMALKKGGSQDGAVLGLVGPESAMARAFYGLQGAREFALEVDVLGKKRPLFATPVRGVIRLDRDEMNRFLMDQTGSVSFIPYIGTILLMPYHSEALNRFSSVAMGLVPGEVMGPGEAVEHVKEADYFPEVIYLGRVDRERLISGWDIGGSMDRMTEMRARVQQAAEEAGSSATVESTTLVLLGRMNAIARLIGILTLLIALPLLWMAWVLAANLSGLLMLNERRTLGLMRLRGIPGVLLGRSLLLAVCGGGLAGGVLGLLCGSILTLLVYERGRLPLEVLAAPEQLLLSAGFLVVTLMLTLLVSRRLVRYATTISPLEASGRIAASEALHARVRFGVAQFLALVLGAYTLAGWVYGLSLSATFPSAALRLVDQALDFTGLPLFLYGVAALIVSHRSWIQGLLAPVLRPIGGVLGSFALQHIAAKPHRTVSFLLIVALMVSVCLYPTITSSSFEDKAIRGARVQMGTEWVLTFNSPDLVPVSDLQRGLAHQVEALRPGVERIQSALARVKGVKDSTYMVEAILPNFFLPGYGFRGVPMYLVGDIGHYAENAYSEPELGLTGAFKPLLEKLKGGAVVVSPPVAEFWRLNPGASVLVGMDDQRRTVFAPSAGTVAFLPGTPPRTVTDRQGYVQARLDYMNYLFSNNAYLVGSADNGHWANLQALVPRVIVLVRTETRDPGMQAALLAGLPASPMEVHNLEQEIQKVGSDMFIALAVENMRIFLVGGLLLALIAILAIAMANYQEDRRTFALLRIRGASPLMIWRFLTSMLLSPGVLGLLLGGSVALVAGFGLTNYIWRLRELRTVVQLLPTHLVISGLTAATAVFLLVPVAGVALLFSLWVFRRSAREGMQEG